MREFMLEREPVLKLPGGAILVPAAFAGTRDPRYPDVGYVVGVVGVIGVVGVVGVMGVFGAIPGARGNTDCPAVGMIGLPGI